MAASATSAAQDAAAAPGVKEVGRMVDSSQADDRKMIRLVRERRLLYARNNMPVASYYSRVKGLWREVAHEMDWSGETRTHTHNTCFDFIHTHLFMI